MSNATQKVLALLKLVKEQSQVQYREKEAELHSKARRQE